jgi:rod shape determining protein RodA
VKNWLIISCIICFGFLSVVTLRSVTPSLAIQQLIYVIIGLGLFGLVSQISFSQLQKWHWLGFASLIVLLIIPLILGIRTRGIAAWIDIGPWFSIQPSQLAIPVAGLTLACWLAETSWQDIRKLLGSIIIIGLPAVLIALEPDLGTLMVYLASLGSAVFLAGLPWRYVLVGGAGFICTCLIAWVFLLQPYQKDRITSFLEEDDVLGAGYNAEQAVIAVGSGQWWGRGVGQGSQSHLRFLPERQTDFIFASLAEEWGFLGSSLVLILYVSLICLGLWLAIRHSSIAGKAYAGLTVVMLVTQVGINVGMNMHLMPITGITLPFLSFGGSSFLSLCIHFGIVQNLLNQIKTKTPLHFS